MTKFMSSGPAATLLVLVLVAVVAAAEAQGRFYGVELEGAVPPALRTARRAPAPSHIPIPQAARVERSHHHHHDEGHHHGPHVDYGAHTGHHGAFGWYADFPVKH